jgi:hypothetical protein
MRAVNESDGARCREYLLTRGIVCVEEWLMHRECPAGIEDARFARLIACHRGAGAERGNQQDR